MAALLKEYLGTSYLFGANAPFIEELYEAYLADAESVAPEWRRYFDQLQRLPGSPDVAHEPIRQSFVKLVRAPRAAAVRAPTATAAEVGRKQVWVLQLANNYRRLGMLQANVDPLKRFEKPNIPELDPASYGLSEEDMEATFNTASMFGPEQMPLREILRALRETYCGSIGAEYWNIADPTQRRWIQQRLEPMRAQPSYSVDFKRFILERLTAAETLERYLHTRYVGQKRFSLEGGESLIPLLDHLLQRAGEQGVQETVIGMAHRGRLNVLVNTMGKTPRDLFSEFEGKHAEHLPAGDVKYHMGFSSDINTPGGPMHLSLAFNPSHLEIVNPVVEGSVRARQHRRKDREGKQVLPVLIHGDAAFAGQGVVMETLNLSQTRGYRTGGTVHVIVNNQIGFTTSDTRDVRSTLYCTDVVKMIDAPVFHVSGDDPEAVCFATELALDFRMEFQKDVVIDLVCFRRHGHNEQDEPMVTQPLMYKLVSQHPGTRKLYADRLATQGVVRPEDSDEMIRTYRTALDQGYHTNQNILTSFHPPYAVNWERFRGAKWTDSAQTGLPIGELKALADKLTKVPAAFKLHPRVEKVIADRRQMAQDKLPLDWGMAENLAYAALIKDGYGVRLSGQDTARGTFFHRHAVLHDQARERWDAGTYIPLQHIAENQPTFVVIDSVLSEEAVMGFEYGYATAEPNELIVWEAQFGDFANGAQVVIDQFIASGEVKWGRLCGLTLMLPHGYEGQGPEHSSARLERFLQLCADYNMQIVVPSTPAQMFHVLRRQMVRPFRKPLIIMSPKSMLRHKESASSLEELAEGRFHPVIGETDDIDPANVRKVVFCSGKVYYDVRATRRERGIKDIAIVRLEQLYPFPHDEYTAQIQKYAAARDIVWCQEEPGNQGAWHRIQHYLLRHMLPHQELAYALRPSSASPAAGYMALHAEQQKAVIEAALAPAA